MLSENYVSSISWSAVWANGGVTNPNNLAGTQGNQFANIYSGNPDDGGYIVGQMNAPSGGTFTFTVAQFLDTIAIFAYTYLLMPAIGIGSATCSSIPLRHLG